MSKKINEMIKRAKVQAAAHHQTFLLVHNLLNIPAKSMNRLKKKIQTFIFKKMPLIKRIKVKNLIQDNRIKIKQIRFNLMKMIKDKIYL
jgi:hypothetical protein